MKLLTKAHYNVWYGSGIRGEGRSLFNCSPRMCSLHEVILGA